MAATLEDAVTDKEERFDHNITRLNTSCKFLNGLIGKYVRNHAVENETWDE